MSEKEMDDRETEKLVKDFLYAISLEGEYLTDESGNADLWNYYE